MRPGFSEPVCPVLYGWLRERACSLLTCCTDVMVRRKTVLKVRNLRGQLCSSSKGVHIRNIRTKLMSHWGIMNREGGNMLQTFQKTHHNS